MTKLHVMPELQELPEVWFINQPTCLSAFLTQIKGSLTDAEAKGWCRAFMNMLGPKVLSVTWMHDKPAVNHLMYRSTTKTMMGLVRGFIDYLPTRES